MISDKATERRRYIRLKVPIEISYTAPERGRFFKTVTKDISGDGLRFESSNKTLKPLDLIYVNLSIPGGANPVHTRARIKWKKKVSLEDASPFDIGVEFAEIEEDNKNTFLKFICDLLYNISDEKK